MSVHSLSLSHFSDQRVAQIDATKLPDRGGAYKPRGFWVSVDGPDSWEDSCISEGYGLKRLAIRHRVTLAPSANVLHVSSVDELDDFADQYAVMRGTGLFHSREIDWSSVAANHDGIIIAPYQWARRLHDGFSWYYGWDCASGCIWNTDAIGKLEVVADLLRGEAEGLDEVVEQVRA